MSFSSNVKKELCANQSGDREMLKAELYGILLFGKTFREDSLVFTTESSHAAKRVTFLLENLFFCLATFLTLWRPAPDKP